MEESVSWVLYRCRSDERTVTSYFGFSPGSQPRVEVGSDLGEAVEVWAGDVVEEMDVGLGESGGDETVLLELVC